MEVKLTNKADGHVIVHICLLPASHGLYICDLENIYGRLYRLPQSINIKSEILEGNDCVGTAIGNPGGQVNDPAIYLSPRSTFSYNQLIDDWKNTVIIYATIINILNLEENFILNKINVIKSINQKYCEIDILNVIVYHLSS